MINQEANQIQDSFANAEEKQKQYEYLQSIWGIKYKHPHKIAKEDVKGMIITRIILSCLLAFLSVCVHCLGRCEPLSFILALMIFKNWKYVITRSDKFIIAWIVILSICLDLIWLTFAAYTISLINYLNLTMADILTYLLVIVKGVLLVYMLLIQKAFSINSDPDTPDSR